MKKRIVTAVITACLALCAAVWPQPDTREGRTRPNTNARRSCRRLAPVGKRALQQKNMW